MEKRVLSETELLMVTGGVQVRNSNRKSYEQAGKEQVIGKYFKLGLRLLKKFL